jgi:hypothetical protein
MQHLVTFGLDKDVYSHSFVKQQTEMNVSNSKQILRAALKYLSQKAALPVVKKL